LAANPVGRLRRAAEVQAVLTEGDDDRARQVLAYERAHKNRAGVLKAA
jgi:hypothetical protein